VVVRSKMHPESMSIAHSDQENGGVF
jgi:hypothetical protein